MKIGSHVGMSGKEMLLGSAKEAVSYGASPLITTLVDTFSILIYFNIASLMFRL